MRLKDVETRFVRIVNTQSTENLICMTFVELPSFNNFFEFYEYGEGEGAGVINLLHKGECAGEEDSMKENFFSIFSPTPSYVNVVAKEK